MRPRLTLLWMLVLAASAAGLVVSGRASAGARTNAAGAIGQMTSVCDQARELATLRSTGQRGHKPGSGLAARVTASLTRCGLPASALSSLSPETMVGAGASAKRQRAVLGLGPVTLPQVGAFLEAWRTAEPAWVVASVDLSPVNSGTPTPGADLPLRAVIGLEAVYAEESAPMSGGGEDRPGGAH